MSNTYTVKLDAFEGPLEALLELIEKNKLDISNVSLALVADQFIEHINTKEEKEPKYLADFLVVAAKLILIKSKALLPLLDVTKEEEEEIHELKEKLERYREIRAQARALGALEKQGNVLYHRSSQLRSVKTFLPPPAVTTHTLHELYCSVARARAIPNTSPQKHVRAFISFAQSMREMKLRIERCARASFRDIADARSKAHVIVSFLAILELVRQKFLFVRQEEAFGEITLMQMQNVNLKMQNDNVKT